MNSRRLCLVVLFPIQSALLWCGCSNMKKQAHLTVYAPSEHFPDGTSAQPPPAHTVPHGFHTALASGPNLENTDHIPRPIDRSLLARGQERFDIYCAVCHGPDGYGHGIVVQRGFTAPPSFHDDRLRAATVGHFFNVITHGYGAMYSYADRVDENDRWAIAAYIRALQRSQHATLADVPANDRATLSSP